MKKYEKYKNSGIEWIGEIPEHWEIRKLKYTLSALESGSRQTGGGNQLTHGVFSLGGEHIGWMGELLLKNPKLITEDYYDNLNSGKIFANDILLVKDGATIGKIAIIKEKPFDKCAVNEHVFILRANQEYEPSFIFYYLWCDIGQVQISINIKGSAQPGLNTNFVNDTFLTYLPITEQTTIANYLDRKTAEIDDLITKKEQLLTLYEEEKTAIINQTVTKGINPDIKMKDSGIDWLGDPSTGLRAGIPEHWDITALKRLTNKITDGEHISPKFVNAGMPFLSAKDVRDGFITLPDDKFIEFEDGFRFRKRCNPENNDILLVSRGATIGRVAKVNTNTEFCLLGSVILMKPKININPLYLFYSLKNKLLQDNFLLSSQSSAQQAIYLIDVVDVKIAIPPIDEQSTIVVHIEKETARIDAKIQKTKKLVALQKEYRTALISEVVTRKIKVTES